jgi:hypothetical protein
MRIDSANANAPAPFGVHQLEENASGSYRLINSEGSSANWKFALFCLPIRVACHGNFPQLSAKMALVSFH